jgi:hypothetical protein
MTGWSSDSRWLRVGLKTSIVDTKDYFPKKFPLSIRMTRWSSDSRWLKVGLKTSIVDTIEGSGGGLGISVCVRLAIGLR